MKFIKVTDRQTGIDAFINVQSIQSVLTYEGVNYLKTTGAEQAAEILETPEEVLRMLGAWEETFVAP